MNPRRVCTPRIGATWIALSVLTGGTPAVFAAEVENALTHVDISRCVGLAASADRLACYDAAAAKAKGAASTKGGGAASVSVAANGGPAAKTAAWPTTADAASGTVSGAPTAQASPTEKTSAAKAGSKPVVPARVGDDDAATFGKTPAKVVKGADGQQELHDTIAALKAAPQGGAWIITLSNGQVWRQTEPEPYNLKQGYAVRIYPSRWGTSYRLSTEQIHGFIQVERIDSRE
jgi:hypothetical protein